MLQHLDSEQAQAELRLPRMNTVIERQPSSLAESAQRAAATLMADLDGVRAVLIATGDGTALAHVGRLPVDAAWLAAMAGSLSLLCDTTARETGVGDTRYLVVEAGAGRIIVRRLQVHGADLAAVLLTDKSVLLGMAWSRIGQAEQAMNAEWAPGGLPTDWPAAGRSASGANLVT